MAFLSHFRSDAVQAEAALDALRLVFRTLVVFEDKRLAPDRPVNTGEIALCQPILLGEARVSEAGRDRDRGRAL
jgi:hypothetical protein